MYENRLDRILLLRCEGQKLERRNVERPEFRNLKISNIKITKDELIDSFISEFIVHFLEII